MPKIYAAHEMELQELIQLGEEVLARSHVLEVSQQAYDDARSRWRMAMEVSENRKKYYNQYHLRALGFEGMAR